MLVATSSTTLCLYNFYPFCINNLTPKHTFNCGLLLLLTKKNQWMIGCGETYEHGETPLQEWVYSITPDLGYS